MPSNPNTGGLWKNPYKRKGDTRPDLTGVMNVDGQDVAIVGWINSWEDVNARGVPRVSLKRSATDEGSQTTVVTKEKPRVRVQNQPPVSPDDDIPF